MDRLKRFKAYSAAWEHDLYFTAKHIDSVFTHLLKNDKVTYWDSSTGEGTWVGDCGYEFHTILVTEYVEPTFVLIADDDE